MKILGLDPGTTQSAVVVYDTDEKRVEFSMIAPNAELLGALVRSEHETDGTWLRLGPEFQIGLGAGVVLVIEKIEGMGMAVGQEVMETIFWSGRLFQAWPAFSGSAERVSRRDVKLHLCGSMRAKDANVRQALIDKLGAPGTKKHPGATYGVSSHCWAALAVAVTYTETQCVPASLDASKGE